MCRFHSWRGDESGVSNPERRYAKHAILFSTMACRVFLLMCTKAMSSRPMGKVFDPIDIVFDPMSCSIRVFGVP